MSQESDATPLEQKQAEAIARWLDGGPRPSDIDAEVAQAIYALRPDLAPPLTMTSNDLMASLGLETDAEIQSGEPEPLVHPGAGDIPAPANNRQWFFTGLIGLAVAAAGLIVAVTIGIPSSGELGVEEEVAKLNEEMPSSEALETIDKFGGGKGSRSPGAPEEGAAIPISTPPSEAPRAPAMGSASPAPPPPQVKGEAVASATPAAPEPQEMTATPADDLPLAKSAPPDAEGALGSGMVGSLDMAYEVEDEMAAFEEDVAAAYEPAPAPASSAKRVADAAPRRSARPAAPDSKVRKAMLASAPSTPMCSAARGVADLVIAGEHQKAIHRAERSLMTRDWKPPECLSAIAHWHGRALLESGQPEEALQYFERAIELKSAK